MKLKKMHWIGVIFSMIIIWGDVIFFFGDEIFLFLLGIGAIVVLLPFLIGLMIESKVEKEKSDRFLEFTRNLAESVKTGTPIGKSIINMSSKDFGSLTPYIQKLANQIDLGIPIGKALETFAEDVNSAVVSRAVTLIQEAQNAGGNIDTILDSTAEAIYQIEKLKQERKAAISNLVVQGYIIFFVFVGIMLVMQFKILPLVAGVSTVSAGSTSIETAIYNPSVSTEKLARPFLYLLLVQGFFTGLTIGKVSEGYIKAGIKHSIVMTLLAFMISSGAGLFL